MREVTASALSRSVAADPPAGLRASILAEIATTPQDESAVRDDGGSASCRGRIAPAPAPQAGQPGAPEGSNVVPIRRLLARVERTSLVAAAAVIAAVALRWLGDPVARMRGPRRDGRGCRQPERGSCSTCSAQTTCRPSPDGHAKTGHTGTVVMSQERGQALLVASDLPDLPDDKVYEAWTIDGETPVAAGTFTSDGDAAMVQLPDARSAPTVWPSPSSPTAARQSRPAMRSSLSPCRN